MPIDVAAVRADTPAVSDLVHFNNCGSSLPPKSVVLACTDYIELEAEIGGYEAYDREVASLDRVYEAGAQMLGCDPAEIAFTTGAAQGWWRSFDAVPLAAGDRILISSTEYQANGFAFIQAAQRGVEIEQVPATSTGEIDLEALERMLDERVKMVSVTQIAMSNGMVQPVAEVGRIVKNSGAYYIVDACQAAGQVQLDVEEIGCDFLSFTGRKFLRGPRGTGLLYARLSVLDDLVDPSVIDGRSAIWTGPSSYELAPTALRFELGEVSFAAKAGFAVALDYALRLGLDEIEARVFELAAEMRAGLVAVGGVTVHDQGARQSGIVTFAVAGCESARVTSTLRDHAINTSAIGVQLSQLDLGQRAIPAVVRAGVHYFNTSEEVDKLVEVVASVAR
ncbi:MAG: aminotransferase class V-fold PLP-dependent enzyme [Acidimicrobiales bacterium]